MPFLYKDRQKQKATSINGVVKTPDYCGIEPIPELRERIKPEVNRK